MCGVSLRDGSEAGVGRQGGVGGGGVPPNQPVPSRHTSAPAPPRASPGSPRCGSFAESRNPPPRTTRPQPEIHLSRRHDQSYKLLFSLPLAIEHMIRGFVDGRLAGELDFARAESLATERSTPGLVRSQADMLWKVHFRGSSRYLLVQLEFQSAPERYMSVRALCYIALHYQGLIGTRERRTELAPGGLLPPALAITIYNGRQRWTAPENVFDLIEPVRGWLAERQPKLRHQVLDLRTLARQPPIAEEPNVVAWIASMELDPSGRNVMRVVREMLAVYGGPKHARLREAFREWVLGAAESWGIGDEVLEQVKSLKEAGMIYAGVEEQKEQAHREGFGRGRMEGRAEGRMEGRATLVCRQARLKFGARTAERLSRRLDDITDPEAIARIGDQIIECETGEELLARAGQG